MGELVTVRTFGAVPGEVLAEARARVAAVAAAAGQGTLVEALRIRLAAAAGGLLAHDGVLAQVNAEVDGRRIRVQAAAAGPGDPLDRVAEALRARIRAATGAWVPRPWAASAVPPAPVPVGLPAEGTRHIVRRKRPWLVRCTPEAAARTMDAMDYDIHLFTDPATGTDAVVYRVGPTGYRLARTLPAGPAARRRTPITLSPHGAPRLTEEEAVDRLTAAELPFLFFAHPANGRGRVLYRRFDGNLGLIAGRDRPGPALP
ncbi:sigma 54 modulation/S30EA ribosomal C-terminal domain-containing protein [Streptomyces sp. Y1]|uniref:Sigma 54 modulation/S30EA ribosomal C-terminal domain-containing protein n=1 Tax=Streptomyces sp. Y1 TaxID=3238634 RepID=A0AB39TUR6_9ACTN